MISYPSDSAHPKAGVLRLRAMRVSERRRLILESVQQHGGISIREAARLVHPSGVPARRDLPHLAEEGLIRRTHGGAAAPNIVSHEAPFLEKAQLASAEK